VTGVKAVDSQVHDDEQGYLCQRESAM
jgi:hypothetical protein